MSTPQQTIRALAAELAHKAQSLDEKTRKKYRVNYIIGAAEKVAVRPEAATDTEIVTLLGNVVKHFPVTPEGSKVYAPHVNRYEAYARRKYQLVAVGYYKAVWLSLGIAIGMPMGLALKNLAAGIPIGLGIGLAIGTGLDNKAQKEGRAITL